MRWKSDGLPYSPDYDRLFLKRMKKLKRDNLQLYERLKKKMVEILENPDHHKPLSNILKGKRRAHVGSFVIMYRMDEEGKKVVFLEFDHHDKVYK